MSSLLTCGSEQVWTRRAFAVLVATTRLNGGNTMIAKSFNFSLFMVLIDLGLRVLFLSFQISASTTFLYLLGSLHANLLLIMLDAAFPHQSLIPPICLL
ncbi:hypothetical protein EGR_11282 [Echinococcus granulosus]|uniref:Uncharacterized protein n=1 Tax=Echinococcus granulosus TaxID=6210 RepID=W6U6A1_ECHGR|nr:hypothetical protein EGR_11282 [Echinococcus granulosus]EUB53867.1 hypothetical protein EGR_11282 [Echinococcus granulosus]